METGPAEERSSPRVSVITATFERLGLLKEAVGSVRQQGSPSWEHIVVDDASSDGTAEWLAVQRDPRLRVITFERHAERCAARNAGTEAARGEYVLYLDHDDRLRPGALAGLAGILDRYPRAVAVAGGVLYFDRKEAGIRWGPRTFRYGDLLLEAITQQLIFASGTTLYRTSAARLAGPWDDRYIGIEDGEFSFRALALGPAAVSPRLVVEHRGGSTLFHPERSEADALLRRAQREALDRMEPDARARAEPVMRGWAELMRANQEIVTEFVHPVTTWRRTVRAIRRAPAFWLGPGRRFPMRIAWQALRAHPRGRWMYRAGWAVGARTRPFVPWEARVRNDEASFKRARRKWRRRRSRDLRRRGRDALRASAGRLGRSERPRR